MKTKPRVLIVEDEEGFGFMLEHFFKKWEWLVTVATDGLAAVERLGGPAYDLIVLDLMLPGLSGAEVLQEVRRRNMTSPVAVMTGQTFWGAVREVEGLEPDRLFLKDQFNELRRYAAEIHARFVVANKEAEA